MRAFVPAMFFAAALGLVVLMTGPGCQNPPPTATEMLNSSAGPERMRALARLAKERRWSNVPTFIRYLADEDVSVRWAALEALTEQVGTDRGFRPTDPPELRAAAVKRWNEWWQTEGHRGPQTRSASAAS